MQSQKQKQNFLWPTIDSLATAREVARQGVWASAFVAVVTAIIIPLTMTMGDIEGVPPVDAAGFIDVGLFVAIAIGIHKMSRVAAVSGFTLYLLGRIYTWSHVGVGNGLIMSIILSLAFLHAIRATFAYHRLRQQSIQADLAMSDAKDVNVR